jgi:alanyl-tRNA synthetase
MSLGGCYVTAKSKKSKLLISENTNENKRVVSGVFKLIDTNGIPLDIILQDLNKKNIIIDWIDFYLHAKKSGWKLKTIIDKIKYPLIDINGEEYSKSVLYRIEIYSEREKIKDSFI